MKVKRSLAVSKRSKEIRRGIAIDKGLWFKRFFLRAYAAFKLKKRVEIKIAVQLIGSYDTQNMFLLRVSLVFFSLITR